MKLLALLAVLASASIAHADDPSKYEAKGSCSVKVDTKGGYEGEQDDSWAVVGQYTDAISSDKPWPWATLVIWCASDVGKVMVSIPANKWKPERFPMKPATYKIGPKDIQGDGSFYDHGDFDTAKSSGTLTLTKFDASVIEGSFEFSTPLRVGKKSTGKAKVKGTFAFKAPTK